MLTVPKPRCSIARPAAHHRSLKSPSSRWPPARGKISMMPAVRFSDRVPLVLVAGCRRRHDLVRGQPPARNTAVRLGPEHFRLQSRPDHSSFVPSLVSSLSTRCRAPFRFGVRALTLSAAPARFRFASPRIALSLERIFLDSVRRVQGNSGQTAERTFLSSEVPDLFVGRVLVLLP